MPEDHWPAGQPDPLADTWPVDHPDIAVVPDPSGVIARDGWPKDQPDPLADPVAVAEQPVPPTEGEQAQAQPTDPLAEGNTPEAQALIDAEDLTWRDRFGQFRDIQRRTAEENRTLRDELKRASEVIDQALPLLSAQPPPDPRVEELYRVAEDLGMDREQFAVTQALAEAIAENRMAGVTRQLASQEQDRAVQSEYNEALGVQQAFLQAHPEITEEAEHDVANALQYIFRIGEAAPGTPEAEDELAVVQDLGYYEVALEASRDPNLRSVLRALPNLADSEDGMRIARRQASLLGTTPANEQPRTTGAQVDAALRAAHTESGSSGAPPPARGQPRDEFDDVLDFAKTRGRSVFLD